MTRLSLIILLLLAALPFLPQPAHAFTNSIAITQSQLANLSVGSQLVSIRWRVVDQSNPILVSLFFHSYQNSGAILDEGLVSENRTQYPSSLWDPSHTFQITILSSQSAQDGSLVFQAASDAGHPSITISTFTGSVISDVGLPGNTFQKAVVTSTGDCSKNLGDCFDVLTDNNWRASFSWQPVKLGNSTVPQVIVFDTTGAQIDGRYVTAIGPPLLPVRGSSGFWLRALQILPNGVSWRLESSLDIIIRPNQGFSLKSLPAISPDQLVRADFGNSVPAAMVNWLLPVGADTYTLYISGFKMVDAGRQTPDPGVAVILDTSYLPGGMSVSRNANTGYYTLKFRPVRLGVTVPVSIDTVAADGKYSGHTTVEFRPASFWDPTESPNYLQVSAGSFSSLFLGVFFILAYRRRHPFRIDPRLKARDALSRRKSVAS